MAVTKHFNYLSTNIYKQSNDKYDKILNDRQKNGSC